MSEAFKKLIKTLQNIFEMDKADLDFGIYRIMNQKREEINKFLNEDLLPQVKKAFEDFADNSNKQAHDELKNLTKTLEDAGMDPDSSPKILELKKQISSSVDITALENDVFSKLHTFFSRYYDKGDFISQRRYKPNTYAIPYEGEEVKLYWANHDQYYIKSSEHLRDYAFIAKDGQDNDQPFRIKLVEADTEKDNIKEKADEERRFVLNEQKPLSIENGELIIHFNFIPVGKKDQKKLNEDAVKTIFNQTDKEFTEWLHILKKPAPTEKNKDRTLLEKHIHSYTARNTFDYFIHKNLGEFLRRELDFFIKNEILHLDDIDDNTFELTTQQLRKIKILRIIAHKIIRMLAQIEDFQKKLWLKKKFVVETNYCFTLDFVPNHLFDQIVLCKDQWKEWLLYNLITEEELDKKQTLEKKPYLMVDTKYFDNVFKEEILKRFDDLDEQIDGLLINSENFQAANLISQKYQNAIDLVYLDPPYNTDATPILYKNGYKESSWISLMADRLKISESLLNSNGVLSIAIDDKELCILRQLISGIFPEKDIFQCIIEHYPGSGTGRTNVSRTHEYCLFIVDKNQDILRGASVPDGDRIRGFRRAGTGDNNFRRGNPGRPESFFAILVDPITYVVIGAEPPPSLEEEYPINNTNDGYKRVYPIGEDGTERVWSLSYEGALKAIKENRIISSDKFVIKRIYKDEERRLLLPSIWQGSDYNATSNGTNLLTDIFGEAGLFSYPKALGTISKVIDSTTYLNTKAIIVDLFAGSGTTAHAVIERNRQFKEKNKYIIVEMGEHADSLIKQRINKIVFSCEWNKGRPIGNDGISHIYKYIRLETYEDTLNNLCLSKSNQHQNILDLNSTFYEDYMLGYWLDIETSDSANLIKVDHFISPYDYKLNISSKSVGVNQVTNIDLVETFNYLIGLKIKTIDTIRGFKVIIGTNKRKESVLIIWRNINEKNNVMLEDFLDKQGYNPRDTEFQHIYVNGDHTLEDPHSKVKMIEIEFKRLMFDVKGI
ncbi:TPA: DNA methyltransferase [Legionella pneumophila]|nr:site-specific DNA-methyltransferase [Legionella pneumophila]